MMVATRRCTAWRRSTCWWRGWEVSPGSRGRLKHEQVSAGTRHVSRVTSAVHGEPQPVLLGLEQLPVDGDLHVEGDLGVHQALVLLLVPAQLLHQLLYLTLLRSNLKINTFFTLNIGRANIQGVP